MTNLFDPGHLIPVRAASFVKSYAIPSPMGGSLGAFASRAEAERFVREKGGEIVAWDRIVSAVPRARHESDRPRLLGLLAVGPLQPAQAAKLHVGPGRPYREIRPALAAASGSAVIVHSGRPAEDPLVTDKPLSLDGVDLPAVDGEGKHEILSVRAGRVTVRHFRFENVGRSAVRDNAAIKVEAAAGCRTEENQFRENFFGVYLAGVRGCAVRGNRLLNRAGRPGFRERGPPVEVGRGGNSGERRPRVPGPRLLRVRDRLGGRGQPEREEPPLRAPLHVLGPVPLHAEPVPGERVRGGGDVQPGVAMEENWFRGNWGRRASACC